MESSNRLCIRCVPGYTYGDYVYFNNSFDEPKKHHIHFILNHNPNFYITSLSKFIDDTFTSLPNYHTWIKLIQAVTMTSKSIKTFQGFLRNSNGK